MPGPVVLINPDTQNAESFAPDQAQQMVQSGYHVPLVDQNGDAYAAPIDEAQQLIQQGTHTQPNAAQLQYLMDQSHYNSTGQQAGSFINGALESVSGGIAGSITDSLGLTTPQDRLKQQEFNPGLHALGEATGIIGGMALAPETSIPGLISHAGEAAAKGIALTGTFGKAAQLATRGAIEGGLFAASHQVSEALLGDPNQTAENVLSDIGLSAALGGGLNLALSPIFAGIGKTLDLGAGFLGRGTTTATEAGKSPGSLMDILPHTGLDETEKNSVLKGLTELKPNAGEIQKAADAIGAPVLESQLSNSKFVQDLDSSLMQSPSWTGIQRQQLVKEGFSAVNDSINEALGADIGMSQAQVGNELKKGLIDKLTTEADPINQLYSSIKDAGQNVPLASEQINSIKKAIMDTDGLLSSKGTPLAEGSPSYQLAKRVTNELENLGTVDDLRRYAQQIGQDTAGKPELRYISGQIQNTLKDFSDSSILKYAKAQNNPEVESLIEQHAAAKQRYANLRDKMDTLGSVVGKKLRKGEGLTAFTDWLSDAPPEKIASRLFTKNNSEFLGFMKENFPQEFELLRNLKKSEFRDLPGAFKDGQIQPNRILGAFDKLEPEIQNALFSPEELSKLKAAQTWIESLPANVGPSGTPKGLQFFDLFRHPIAATANQGADFLKKNIIKQLVKASPGDAPLINTLMHLSNFSARLYRGIEKNASAIFGRASASILDQQKKNEQSQMSNEPLPMHSIAKPIMAHMNNPEGLIDHLTQATQPLAPYAPNTVNALSTGIGRAVNFLSQKIPQEQKAAPLDVARKPSNAEIAIFNRYASIVENPLDVLKHVKAGTVLPQDIEAISQVYPSLYQKMQSSVTEKLINAAHKDSLIPYKTRLGLSLFLGQNLDSTMSPQGIMASQVALNSMAIQKQAEQSQQMQKTRPSKAGMGKMHIDIDQTRAQQSLMRERK